MICVAFERLDGLPSFLIFSSWRFAVAQFEQQPPAVFK